MRRLRVWRDRSDEPPDVARTDRASRWTLKSSAIEVVAGRDDLGRRAADRVRLEVGRLEVDPDADDGIAGIDPIRRVGRDAGAPPRRARPAPRPAAASATADQRRGRDRERRAAGASGAAATSVVTPSPSVRSSRRSAPEARACMLTRRRRRRRSRRDDQASPKRTASTIRPMLTARLCPSDSALDHVRAASSDADAEPRGRPSRRPSRASASSTSGVWPHSPSGQERRHLGRLQRRRPRRSGRSRRAPPSSRPSRRRSRRRPRRPARSVAGAIRPAVVGGLGDRARGRPARPRRPSRSAVASLEPPRRASRRGSGRGRCQSPAAVDHRVVARRGSAARASSSGRSVSRATHVRHRSS